MDRCRIRAHARLGLYNYSEMQYLTTHNILIITFFLVALTLRMN